MMTRPTSQGQQMAKKKADTVVEDLFSGRPEEQGQNRKARGPKDI